MVKGSFNKSVTLNFWRSNLKFRTTPVNCCLLVRKVNISLAHIIQTFYKDFMFKNFKEIK